ncbi:alpha/beta hydrolase [Lysobacter fragariae]
MVIRLLLPLLLCLPGIVDAAEGDRPHTAGPGVSTLMPPLKLNLGFARQLRVYLPPGYAEGMRRYPVLYMFDGQNLFDDATSYVGEWGVDESMDALARDDGFAAIVVGIDHGGDLRINELIPYWNVRFLPNAGAVFLDDLVQVIKPFVDANYRTLPDRAHTAILGSSLGGLEADYAIHRYPGVFGKAGVFSPSYWVSGESFQRAEKAALPADARVYLYMGGKEGDESVPDAQRMARILRGQMSEGNVAFHVVDDAEHNERAWRAEFPTAVRWLFDVPSGDGVPNQTATPNKTTGQ